MRTCKTCGTVLDTAAKFRGASRHEKRCKNATPEERKKFKEIGHWPRGKRFKVSHR